MELYLVIVVILFGLAISDLIVGVSNDAVNFLNSALGSKISSRTVIFTVASLGLIVGTTFSSGMMEIARKGIFNPEMFYLKEVMFIFLAVMFTDVLLLDLYNTFGLPTSTTVSLVFGLLGAAFCMSLIKLIDAGQSIGEILNYINTSKALGIVSGILSSVIIAFTVSVVAQFFTRIIFTFEFERKLKRYGAIWGGIALTFLLHYILVKGTKGSALFTESMNAWISENGMFLALLSFTFWFIIFQFFITFTRFNIFKPIILFGTFALALSFAANDLVNFIGVPLAGFSSYIFASEAGNPNMLMNSLNDPVKINMLFLMGSGIIMIGALWMSKKSRTVSKTEINLSRQNEGYERFESSALSRSIVRMTRSVFDSAASAIPQFVKEAINKRFAKRKTPFKPSPDGEIPAFDYLRASVNLVVASALISFGTSLKLPLSTTYVTFMVAMGSSFADRAWGRESAVYRVNGVITVIGGWFFTGFMAFTIAAIFAAALYFGELVAVVLLVALAVFLIFKTHVFHKKNEEEKTSQEKLATVKKFSGFDYIKESMTNISEMIATLPEILSSLIDSLATEDLNLLKEKKQQAKQFNKTTVRIISFILTAVKNLGNKEIKNGKRFGKLITSVQDISNSLKNISNKCYEHIDNNHNVFTDAQFEELKDLFSILNAQIYETKKALDSESIIKTQNLITIISDIQEKIKDLEILEVERIKDGTTTPRNSLLYLDLLAETESMSNSLNKLINALCETKIKPEKPVTELKQ